MHGQGRGMGRGPPGNTGTETNEAMKRQDKEIGWQETHTDGTTLIVWCTAAVPMGRGWRLENAVILSIKMLLKHFFSAELGIVSFEPRSDLKSYTYVLTWNHMFFFPLCMCLWVCVCVWGFCRTLLCLPKSARRQHTKHVAQCSLCVFPLCVCACAFGILCVDRVPGCPRWL